MIQRIQTIFMLVAVMFVVPLLYLPFATISGQDDILYVMKIWGVYAKTGDVSSHMLNLLPVMLAFVLSFLIPLVNIFLYKRRKMQIRYNGFAILTNTILIAVMFYFIEKTNDSLAIEGTHPDYGFALFLPAVSIVMLFLANRNIKKDEALIRSVDRIR
ncbi:MAG: DUF4293 domain-containing protein [Flavobacteriales bacterium]